MRYYIRHTKSAKVEGPFTVEALRVAIRAGRIPRDAWAASDLGDAVADLQSWRSSDWFPLGAIETLQDFFPSSPEPVTRPGRVSGLTVIGLVGTALSLSCQAISDRRWFVGVVAALMVFVAAESVVRYVRQRSEKRPTARIH